MWGKSSGMERFAPGKDRRALGVARSELAWFAGEGAEGEGGLDGEDESDEEDVAFEVISAEGPGYGLGCQVEDAEAAGEGGEAQRKDGAEAEGGEGEGGLGDDGGRDELALGMDWEAEEDADGAEPCAAKGGEQAEDDEGRGLFRDGFDMAWDEAEHLKAIPDICLKRAEVRGFVVAVGFAEVAGDGLTVSRVQQQDESAFEQGVRFGGGGLHADSSLRWLRVRGWMGIASGQRLPFHMPSSAARASLSAAIPRAVRR